MPQERRPRLTPAIADVRRAVREALAGSEIELVLVGLSGGADSLALAAATAFEAPRSGIRAGAVIVDHALQHGSAEVAERAAAQARALGLSPVLVKRVRVGGEGGPEAAARAARYGAFDEALIESGADAVLLAHTLDDQAETVLLGLARGAGASSLHGMAERSGAYLRPLLALRRTTTRAFCADAGLEPWDDPHNEDPSYARVRVRTRLLPALEDELGPGVAEALARTAAQLREDGRALDRLAAERAEAMLTRQADGSIAVDAAALAAETPAVLHRIIRTAVRDGFGVSLHRSHTLATAALVTDWHGQGPLDLPGIRVVRQGGRLIIHRRVPPR